MAETPGIGKILIFSLIHSFKSIKPGSDRMGVPASEMSDITSPFLINSIIEDVDFFSLNYVMDVLFN